MDKPKIINRVYDWNAIVPYRPVPLAMAIVLLLCTQPAYAYLGPGGAASAIGTALALLAALLMAVLGFIWFPVRRLLRKRKQSQGEQFEQGTDNSLQEQETASE